MMKNQKGITLIALVITIIVLLILAGVSIAMLSGPNGLLTQAKEAKRETNLGEVKDRIDLALQAMYSKVLQKKTPTKDDIPDWPTDDARYQEVNIKSKESLQNDGTDPQKEYYIDLKYKGDDGVCVEGVIYYTPTQTEEPSETKTGKYSIEGAKELTGAGTNFADGSTAIPAGE